MALAAREIMERAAGLPDRGDRFSVRFPGRGLLVHKALECREKGMSFDETVDWLENNNCMCATTLPSMTCFICTGGGRVSKTAAVLGSMINIKPVLHVDDAGHLVAVGKVRGRKKSLTALVDAMEKQIGSWRDKNPVVFISHGDCEEDAPVCKRSGGEPLWHSRIPDQYHRPTIGTHSGPGTVALFYMGDVR